MSGLRYAILSLTLCLAGCLAHQVRDDVSHQIMVFGVEMYSGMDYREIGGVASTEEPCLKGYERSFDALDLIIGYGFDRKIRRISTRNPATSMFGIHPGIPLEEGHRLARKAKLREVSPISYRSNGITLTLLADGEGMVFGVTVEASD